MSCIELFLIILTSIIVGVITYIIQKECIVESECNWIVVMLYFLVYISLTIAAYAIVVYCFNLFRLFEI